VATSGAPAAENATAAIAETAHEGAALLSAVVETSGAQEPRLLAAAKTVPSCRTASPAGVPDPSIASESADLARAPGRKRGLQEEPPSLLEDRGEKRSDALGSTPAAIESPETPATRPPLSAVPSGVTSVQREDPGGAWKSSQKVLLCSESRPIGSVDQEPRRDAACGSGGVLAPPAGSAHTTAQRTIPTCR
jgi:hypothetical protein